MFRRRLTLTVLRRISDDLAVALGAGMFDTDFETHVSRSPLKLDRQGCAEVSAVLERTLSDVLEIGEKSLKRSEETGEEPLSVSVAILHFPTAE